MLDKVGEVLSTAELIDKSVSIEGHTDASGEESYNYDLSFKRASAVRKYLIEVTNIDKTRLTPIPFGEEILAMPEDPLNEKNRRVLFVLSD